MPLNRFKPSSGIFYWPFQGATSFVDLVCFCSVMCLLCLCARLFICALWSPAGKGMTSWLSFVVSNCELVTFPLVSWVRCGTWLYRFLIFASLLTSNLDSMACHLWFCPLSCWIFWSCWPKFCIRWIAHIGVTLSLSVVFKGCWVQLVVWVCWQLCWDNLFGIPFVVREYLFSKLFEKHIAWPFESLKVCPIIQKQISSSDKLIWIWC